MSEVTTETNIDANVAKMVIENLLSSFQTNYDEQIGLITRHINKINRRVEKLEKRIDLISKYDLINRINELEGKFESMENYTHCSYKSLRTKPRQSM